MLKYTKHIRHPLKTFYHKIRNIILQSSYDPNASSEDVLRFQHFTLFLLIGLPLLFLFGLVNYMHGNHGITGICILSAFGLSAGWYSIKYTKSSLAVYRLNSIVYMLLLIYMLCFGGEGGSKILWMYTYPLISIFLLGGTEGVFWSMGVALLSAIFLYNPFEFLSTYPYRFEFKTRFLVTYITVTAITYWFEYLRYHYKQHLEIINNKLEEEISEREAVQKENVLVIKKLEKALDEVKVLSGLVPICASCKKIRDDTGYWNQVEIYISEHSEAEFSHSICPDCLDDLYGNEPWYQK